MRKKGNFCSQATHSCHTHSYADHGKLIKNKWLQNNQTVKIETFCDRTKDERFSGSGS